MLRHCEGLPPEMIFPVHVTPDLIRVLASSVGRKGSRTPARGPG
jgi:hypothetical protein